MGGAGSDDGKQPDQGKEPEQAPDKGKGKEKESRGNDDDSQGDTSNTSSSKDTTTTERNGKYIIAPLTIPLLASCHHLQEYYLRLRQSYSHGALLITYSCQSRQVSHGSPGSRRLGRSPG